VWLRVHLPTRRPGRGPRRQAFRHRRSRPTASALALTLALTLAAALLAGGAVLAQSQPGSAPPAAEPPSPTAGAPTSPDPSAAAGLTVWTTYQGAALAWLQDQAQAFTAAFGKPVEITSMKLGDIKQRAMLEAKKGAAADVFVGVPHDQFSALADAGILADMGDYATGRYLAQLSPQAARAFRYQGTLYGLPLSVEGPALILDTRLVGTVPASYAQLKRLAASLTHGGQYGFAFDAANFYYAYAWLRSYGGYVFGSSPQGTIDPADVGLAAEGSIAGARELKALRFGDHLLPQASDYASIRKLFLDGKLAMTYDGPWAIPAIVRAGIPVKVVPMPTLADGTAWHGFMNVDGVLLDHFSRDRVGAANLAKWLTAEGAQTALARQAGSIPASRQALASVKDDAIIAGFGRALANAVAIPNVPAMGSVWGPMDDALGAIMASADSDVGSLLRRAAASVSTP